MAVPTYVGAGTTGDGDATCSPGLPSGWQPGDILLCFIETDDRWATVGGYELVADHANGFTTRLTTYWKRARAGEAAPTVGDFLHLNGAETTVTNCLIVGAVARANDVAGAAWTGWTNADLANVTERFDDGTITGNGGGIAVYTGEKASAGNFGITTFSTALNNFVWCGGQIALKPSGGSVPTFVAAGTPSAVLGAVDATPGLPAGTQADDILLVFTESADQQFDDPVTISGYQEVDGSPYFLDPLRGLSQQTRLTVHWKRAGSSESAPTVVGAEGDHKYSVILGFRGCVTSGDPWDVVSTGSANLYNPPSFEHVVSAILAFRDGAASGLPWNLVTPGSNASTTVATIQGGGPTTIDECLVVVGIAHNTSVFPNFSGWANADLANVTERVDVGTAIGNAGGFAVATGEKTVAGTFGATTATGGFAGQGWAGYHLALVPGAVDHLPQIIRYR